MASVPVGRIVFTVRALPAIRPVNFILDGGDVVIRTSATSRLAQTVRGAVVAFEADVIDPASRSGWSVTVTGRAAEILDPGEVERLDALLQSWALGDQDCFVRIPAELVSGRRLGRAPDADGGWWTSAAG
jgi:uncharacterized protein